SMVTEYYHDNGGGDLALWKLSLLERRRDCVSNLAPLRGHRTISGRGSKIFDAGAPVLHPTLIASGPFGSLTPAQERVVISGAGRLEQGLRASDPIANRHRTRHWCGGQT